MKVLEQQTDKGLIAVLKEQVAKSRNEIRCAERDLKKANTRLEFMTSVIVELENRA